MKTFRSDLVGPVANLNPVDKHLAIVQLLYGQCKALYACQSLPGAQSGISIVQWWCASGAMSYPHSIPGVRALLSISSGNAALERFVLFSKPFDPTEIAQQWSADVSET